MSLPSTHEVKTVIVDILSSAQDEGQLSQLTVRIVRQRLATHFDLQEDVLTGERYKSFIKTTVHSTLNSLQDASCETTERPRHEPDEKEKPGGATKTRSRKVEQKSRARPADEASASESEAEAPPRKKAAPRPRASKVKVTSSRKAQAVVDESPKKRESERKYTSKAIIASSDEESRASEKPQKEQKAVKASPSKLVQVAEDRSDVEMKSPGSKTTQMNTSPGPSTSNAKDVTEEPMESELSSVIDEPPKKRQKKQAKQEPTKPRKEEKKRGKKEALSKDEETINRLKSIVVACGVRRVWKKEFEGLDKPSQQIKRLQAILGDLGMTPRYSIEKAKAIREQRELAQELKDVQEFERAVKRRGKALRSSSETEELADQEGSNVNVPARSKKNARASIMKFLGDQSEEE